MTEEERLAFKEKYEEWKKTQKYFIVEQLVWAEHGVKMVIRNGDYTVNVGDIMGGAKVLECEAYQKRLDCLGDGMTGVVTLDRMPCFEVRESYRESQ